MKRLIAFLLCGAALCSCSVKEDREACPCWLAVHFDRLQGSDALAARTARGTIALCIYDSQGNEQARQSIQVHDKTSPVMVKVPKSDLLVTATLCPDRKVSFNREFRAAEGCEPDSLYAFFESVDATGEQARVDLDSYKQFSTVHVRFDDTSSGHAEGLVSGLRLSLVSSSTGVDINGLSAMGGRHEYALPDPDSEGCTEGRILRQKKHELSILGYDRKDGTLLHEFPLSDLVEKTGFDWDARNLDDIFVVINLMSGSLGLSVDGWDGEFLFSHVY